MSGLLGSAFVHTGRVLTLLGITAVGQAPLARHVEATMLACAVLTWGRYLEWHPYQVVLLPHRFDWGDVGPVELYIYTEDYPVLGFLVLGQDNPQSAWNNAAFLEVLHGVSLF